MSQLPAITISTRDLDRLWNLLDGFNGESEVVSGLMDELDRASVISPDLIPDDVVIMNSKVRFENEETGHSHEVELVYPHEADGPPGRVSVLAPAGAALLGLHVGDRIEWPLAGRRKLHLRLIEVIR